LYVGIEGVNLKPDFEVLDPAGAPYTVYGYSYGHVPSAKFPSKCKKITDQLTLGYSATCRSIKSGLEPSFDSRCENCMYDHDALNCPPAPIPPFSFPFGVTEAIIKQKADFYNACRGWYLIGLNRCDECLTKADEKCGQLDEEEKNQCILNVCSNYSGLAGHIVSPIVDGLDFHNKCLIEETKEACYTCLREYFVPATYCEQTRDYMARSIIKYPALVLTPRSWTVGDAGTWIGPYDKIIGDQGGMCDDNYSPDKIMLSLICRILPEFKYNGQKMCETYCKQKGMTDEQLRDITDFRPNDEDCGNYKMPESFGGNEPWNALNDGTMHIRGKCCADFWQHDESKYAICVGSQATEEEEPPIEECGWGPPVEEQPWCHCEEGSRPLAAIRNRVPSQPFISPENEECCNACGDVSFEVPDDMANLNKAEFYSNAAPGGSILYVAQGSCNDPDSSICRQSPLGAIIGDREDEDEDEDGDGEPGPPGPPSPPASLCDYIASAPSGIICQLETQNSTNSKDCCNVEHGTEMIGTRKQDCDISSYKGQTLHAGVYNNDSTDCQTSIHVCVPCDSNDPGYPYYGTEYNQCAGKI